MFCDALTSWQAVLYISIYVQIYIGTTTIGLQNSFITPRKFTPDITYTHILPPPVTFGSYEFALHYYKAVFPRMSSKCNHMIGSLLRLASWTQQSSFQIHPSCCMRGIPIHECSTVCLFHLPIESNLYCFRILAIMDKADINIHTGFV